MKLHEERKRYCRARSRSLSLLQLYPTSSGSLPRRPAEGTEVLECTIMPGDRNLTFRENKAEKKQVKKNINPSLRRPMSIGLMTDRGT